MGKLPDFLIIGASRCGTSSLFMNLLQHPQIEGPQSQIEDPQSQIEDPQSQIEDPQCKELYFFERRYNRGIEWYKNQFPETKNHTLCFEATPNYLTNPVCAGRVFRWLPNCKFICLLRNPIERILSYYARWDKIADPYEFTTTNPYHPHVETGIYAKALRKWFGYFPRNQFLIIKSEDFFEDGKKIIIQCFDWLDIESIDTGEPIFYDIKEVKTERLPYKKKVPNGVKEYLKKFYKPYNQELYELLGRDFGWQ